MTNDFNLVDSKRDNKERQERPRIVEIVGPAGTGKTTLCNVISHCSDRVHLCNFPDVREAANIPFFVLYGCQLLATLSHIPGHRDRQLSRREIVWLSIVIGWPKVLEKELRKNKDVIILDQGPVYLLSELREFGPDYLKAGTAKRVWQTWYNQWASTLDVIVLLDAKDQDLTARIRNRDKDHPVKHESEQAIVEFLGRYRTAYERTLAELVANRASIKVLRLDTSHQSPEKIADQILAELEGGGYIV
jgi:broad-specificity NMP kinase